MWEVPELFRLAGSHRVSRTKFGLWLDVLVQVEEVAGVILPLGGHEALVVPFIVFPNTTLVIGIHEVDVPRG
jgi:hypothetical protein